MHYFCLFTDWLYNFIYLSCESGLDTYFNNDQRDM